MNFQGFEPIRAIGAITAVVAAFGLSARAATVEGQVFDRDGSPLAGVTVQALAQTDASRSIFRPSQAATPREDVRGQARTDGAGFFSLTLPAGVDPDRWIVRCAGPWDRVRYTPPDGFDVTDEAAERGRAIVMFAIEDAPGWRELDREIARAGGPETPRGKVLRSRGYPAQTSTDSGGRAEWRYHDAIYVFDAQGKLVDTRPVTPAASNPPGTSGATTR